LRRDYSRKKKSHRINHEIRAQKVRVIGEDKKQVGIMSVREALVLSQEKGLDLVEIAPQASPPVVRIMDYGKFLYEEHKKQQEAKKKQKQVKVKEVQLRPKIDIHDLEVKVRKIKEFFEDGNKVKIRLRLRGREMGKPELVKNLIEKLMKRLEDIAEVESPLKIEGRIGIMLLGPKKVKGGKNAKAKNKKISSKKIQNNGEGEDKEAKSLS